MKIKQLTVMVATGLVCFTGSLVLGWLNAPAGVQAQDDSGSKAESADMGIFGLSGPARIGGAAQSLTEKQLESLIFEARERVRDYEKRRQELARKEQRLDLAVEEIRSDLDRLNELRVELAGTVAEIRRQRQALTEDAIRVNANQVARLQQIASIHDRMDATSGGAMLINMVANGQTDDAVLILSYMQDRTAANVLAEIVNTEPKVASLLCERLKKVTEEK